MKTKMNKRILIINLVLLALLFTFVFYKTIPIPVENVLGSKLPDKFIYGGLYWTSLLQEIEFGNNLGVASFSCLFLLLFTTNNFIKIKNGRKNIFKTKRK